jgi:peptidoglycan/LPS O-acetylase OafA/YrhL
MQLDNGRLMKKALSVRFFQVLSKLSFSIYLVFPIVAMIFAGS